MAGSTMDSRLLVVLQLAWRLAWRLGDLYRLVKRVLEVPSISDEDAFDDEMIPMENDGVEELNSDTPRG